MFKLMRHNPLTRKEKRGIIQCGTYTATGKRGYLMSEQKPVITGSREVLMMGDYVGVCWNGGYVKKDIYPAPVEKYCVMKVWQREPTRWSPGAYIDFVWLVEDPDGEPYERDDSSIAGGLDTTKAARQVAAELIKAAEYIEALGK